MIKNARISGTMIGEEDHGIFTCYVFLDGSGFGGGFGGYALDEYVKEKKKRFGTAYGLQFIIRILKTLGVTEWEKLKGTPCRVETEGVGDRITKIGHFIEDRWFDPAEMLEEMNQMETASQK